MAWTMSPTIEGVPATYGMSGEEFYGLHQRVADAEAEVARLRDALVAGHDALHQLLGLAYARPHGWHIDVAPLEAMHHYEDALRTMREAIAAD